MIVELKCREHPKYKGMRTPEVECVGCEHLYEVRKRGQSYLFIPGGDEPIGSLVDTFLRD